MTDSCVSENALMDSNAPNLEFCFRYNCAIHLVEAFSCDAFTAGSVPEFRNASEEVIEKLLIDAGLLFEEKFCMLQIPPLIKCCFRL